MKNTNSKRRIVPFSFYCRFFVRQIILPLFLLCRLGLGILGRIGLADFLLQDPVLDYITKAVLILSVVYSLLPLVMPKGLLFLR